MRSLCLSFSGERVTSTRHEPAWGARNFVSDATVVLASSRHHFTPIEQLLFSGFLADAIIINHHCGSGMDKSSSRTMREAPYYLDFGVISHAEMQKMANGSEKDRTHHLQSIKGLTKEQIYQPAPLTF